jgi:hypothetical protein
MALAALLSDAAMYAPMGFDWVPVMLKKPVMTPVGFGETVKSIVVFAPVASQVKSRDMASIPECVEGMETLDRSTCCAIFVHSPSTSAQQPGA